MTKALVGYTGFVGSNILSGGEFESVYNSKNITEAFGTHPDLLVFAGLRAEKYLANEAPEKDLQLIYEAAENISRIGPGKLVLISTIDVFKTPKNVDETSVIDTDGLHPYGYNRYRLETEIRKKYPDALIIRLPGLFGENIKKNFIFDMINVIPFMLRSDKFDELSGKDSRLVSYYALQDNGYYKVKELNAEEKAILKDIFKALGFSALNFTDSRSIFQFYNLTHLWDDTVTALNNGLTVWHPATEPVSAGEIYRYITGEEFNNITNNPPADYDYRTIYSELFGGSGGYICDKNTVLSEIKEFIRIHSR